MRTKTETVQHPAPMVENPVVDAEIRSDVDTVAGLEMQEHFQAGVAIGRVDSMVFMATIANSSLLASYENVKKSKAWKYSKNGDGRQFEDFDEFCQERFGKSYRRMRELLADRNLLGQELFEQAEKLGLRQIDYNAIKALPAPRQEIIKEALAEGVTKEDLQQAIQQLAADTQKEIDALSTQVAETKADLEARGKLLTARGEELDRLKVQQIRTAKVDWPEAFKGYIAQVHEAQNKIEQAVAALEGVRTSALAEEAGADAEEPFHQAMTALAAAMETTIARSEAVVEGLRLIYDKTLGAFCEE